MVFALLYKKNILILALILNIIGYILVVLKEKLYLKKTILLL